MRNLDVLIPTYATDDYNRYRIVALNIKYMRARLLLPDGWSARFFVGLQGGDPIALKGEIDRLAGYGNDVAVMYSPTTGLANNLNALISGTDGELILQMDDDHVLRSPIDLSAYIEELITHDWCGWIRLMGVSSHDLTAVMMGNLWVVDWRSRGLYITSNRPHIKKRSFHDEGNFGLYPPRKTIGAEEEAWCHQCKDIGKDFPPPHLADKTGMHVCIPVNFRDSMWDHVGDSWQERGL